MKTLYIGLSKREITPTKPVEMCGYGYYLNRVFKKIDDPLFVRSVAFVQDDRRYLLVNCDLEGIDTRYYDKIKDAISYAKELKDRYTVLWLYYDLFGGKPYGI